MINHPDQSATAPFKLAVLVVLYNQNLTESEACSYLCSSARTFHFTVFDNSNQGSIQKFNQDHCAKENIQYLGTGENVGLSQAYRRSIEAIRASVPAVSRLLILDQDTRLNDPYFAEVKLISETAQNAVYFPSVKTERGSFSPIPLNPKLGSGIKKIGSLSDKLIPINSGTLWPIELFEVIRFDEALFLDMIDYDIFFQLYTQPVPIETHLMTSGITQNFSGENISTIHKDLIRYQIYSKDFLYFAQKWRVPTRYANLLLFKRALKLDWDYKTLRFTQIFFQARES